MLRRWLRSARSAQLPNRATPAPGFPPPRHQPHRDQRLERGQQERGPAARYLDRDPDASELTNSPAGLAPDSGDSPLPINRAGSSHQVSANRTLLT